MCSVSVLNPFSVFYTLNKGLLLTAYFVYIVYAKHEINRNCCYERRSTLCLLLT